MHTSSASLKQVQKSSVKCNRKQRIQRPLGLLMELEGRSSNTFTPKSVRTGVEQNTSTKTKSLTPEAGTSPAIALQSPTTRAHLPRQPTPYKIQHSRTTAVSRARGNDGSLRTYSRVLLHLRGKILDQNDTNKHTDV